VVPTTHPRQTRFEFWQAIRAGLLPQPAAHLVGVAPTAGQQWFRQAGGVITNGAGPVIGRYLSYPEREEIAIGLGRGESIRAIAARIGRAPSTISRERARNSTVRTGYRAWRAEEQAGERAKRPKNAKLATNTALRTIVQDGLNQKWSPEQIALRLRRDHPHDETMRVSHETIYQSIYVQGRGALRRELATCLRTGRALRHPHRHAEHRRTRIPNMINISERPAEAGDRAVPGHWEGDLITGKNNKSAIGTLVERSTRYCMLLHLPDTHDAISVRNALITAINTLPAQLRQSLTWDQGIEMARHHDISIATDIDVYFCDPHSPWQRGSNENTNGLLRQYFPKGTDLSVHSAEHLTAVATELNNRPRKTLGILTPTEALTTLTTSLSVTSLPTHTPAVATTP
jgi:IS30 family transposase